MAENFLLKKYSPIGASARHDNAPAIHSYRTPDTLAEVKATGYFDEIRGKLAMNDWIYVISAESGTAEFAWIMVESDGVHVGIKNFVNGSNAGLDYVVGDIVEIPLETQKAAGLLIFEGRVPTIRIDAVNGSGAVTGSSFIDHGDFEPDSIPVVFALTNIPTKFVSRVGAGAPNDALTATIALQSKQIAMYVQDINAA